MEIVRVILENGVEKDVYGIFYLYNLKYYFIYTEKELDSDGYVVLHLVQVGKEIKNTPDGPLDTGYMVGVEISNIEEWKNVQKSVAEIVNDKKNKTQSNEIKYLPTNMLKQLKIMSKKTFRLLKDIVENDFGLGIETNNDIQPIQVVDNSVSNTEVDSNSLSNDSLNVIEEPAVSVGNQSNVDLSQQTPENNVIIDYRTRFFEEQEKNKELQLEIDNLVEKINNIKNIIGE